MSAFDSGAFDSGAFFVASGGADVTGSLAATETGNDTSAITGGVLVSGSLAVSETGLDTLAASGGVLVSGSLAATEVGNDTAAIIGTIIVIEVVEDKSGPSRHKQRRIHPRIIFEPIEDEEEPIVVIDKTPKQKKPRVPPQFIEFEPLRTEVKPLPIDRSQEIERARLRAIAIEDEEILLLI